MTDVRERLADAIFHRLQVNGVSEFFAQTRAEALADAILSDSELVDALVRSRLEQVGVRYCPPHAGVANEDDDCCDFRIDEQNECPDCGGDGCFEVGGAWEDCATCDGEKFTRCDLVPVYRIKGET